MTASHQKSTETTPYGGYRNRAARQENEKLTHVGPDTPGGEYLRRFWHPVALSSELTDIPKLIRILGEDLILFRDRSNRIGLVHRHCPHRGLSLEYGVCENKGLRCAYHGWLFDVDGAVLETPGEPQGSAAAERVCTTVHLGAYPAFEREGIIFAYLGPLEKKPDFPVFDTYDIPGTERQPYTRDYPCNWVQITENAMDPVHAVFLHARVSGAQFAENWDQLGVRDFYRRETGFFYTNARRVGDNIWVRLHEVILPNLTHAGAVMSMDGRNPKYFGRNTFTRWVVPVDDTTTRIIGWLNYGDRTDPPRPEWRTEEGIDVIEGGMIRNRPAEECQRAPGDYEAFVGQGPITSHADEHLMPTDRGVAMFRTRLLNDIDAVAAGTDPFQPSELGSTPLPTYCSDTVMVVPRDNSDPDSQILKHSKKVVEIIRSADDLPDGERYETIENRLRALEESYQSCS